MSNGRYELRTISQHFGQTVVAIFDNLDDARDAMKIKMRSQDLPVIIYDADEEKPLYPFPKGI